MGMFGLTVNALGTPSNVPTIPYDGLRFWDVGVTWKDVETAAGVFSWTQLDALLGVAAAQGKTVLYTFGKVPTWAGGGAGFNNPPSDIAAGNGQWRAFVTALVQHSLASTTAKLTSYELWNEPNVASYWTGTAAQLLTMCRDAYGIIKQLDPTAMVFGPSGSGGTAINNFILNYYALATAPQTPPEDGFAYHAYLGDKSTNAMGMAALLNDIKVKKISFGIGAEPTWLTEGGWGQNTALNLSDVQQSAYLAVQYILSWCAGVARYYWYAYDNPQWGTLWQSVGLRPPGTAYAMVYGWLTGAVKTSGPTQNVSTGTWTVGLTLAGGAAAQIVWNETPGNTVMATAARRIATLTGSFALAASADINSVTVSASPMLLEL